MSRTPPPKSQREHILTINLEDYFQVGPLSSAVPLRYWPRFETRVEQSTLETLDILDEYGAKATFFAVGWLAEQCGEILNEVVRRGHEVASKGFYHRAIDMMPPGEFRDDALRSRDAIERACGQKVQGYRIARGWLSRETLWALEILAKEGFSYDSSLLPLGRASRWPTELRYVHRHSTYEGKIWELPISSSVKGGFVFPISGGNYVRQLPQRFMEKQVEAWDATVAAPMVFYFHTWELDPAQPRIEAISRLRRIRQYRNLDRMPERIRHYLSSYRFTSVADWLALGLDTVKHEVPRTIRLVETPKATAPGEPVTIVVPCYNEEQALPYLAKTLDEFAAASKGHLDLSVVLVDDGSTDGTPEKLIELFGERPNYRIVTHERNKGVGATTMTGIRHASTDLVCVIDCDCSYDIEHLDRMIPMMGDDVDLVTASPYHRQGSVVNVPHWRLFLSRGLSMLYRSILNNRLATYTACFRVYRRSAMSKIEITRGDFIGITEILVLMDQQGSKIVECPAVLESRLFGFSKMKTILAILGHLTFLSEIIRGRMGRADRKSPENDVDLTRVKSIVSKDGGK